MGSLDCVVLVDRLVVLPLRVVNQGVVVVAQRVVLDGDGLLLDVASPAAATGECWEVYARGGGGVSYNTLDSKAQRTLSPEASTPRTRRR